MTDTVAVPVSVGELVDKITILQIKNEMIADEAKLSNIRNELRILDAIRSELGIDSGESGPAIAAAEATLKAVNRELWDAEDRIRDFDRNGDFGVEFVKVARSIYRLNDRRAEAKREINRASGSAIVEEKGYQPY